MKPQKELRLNTLDDIFTKLEPVPAILEPVEIIEKPRKVRAAAKPKAEKFVKEPVPTYHTYEDFAFEDLQVYAGLDTITTSELLARTFPKIIDEPEFLTPNATGQMVKARAPAIINSIQRVEMPAHEFICDLELNGLAYDVEQNRAFSRRMTDEVAILEERIFSQLGRKVNLDSGQEVAELLYRERGLIVPFTTKSGEPSTDGEALLTLAGLDPMGSKYVTEDPALQYLADMAKRRDINSVHNTFVKTYVEDFVKRDGRVHPSYNLFGTSSFRITGDSPNLTQLPRAKHGYNVRACFRVAQGYIFITFDFSSAEVKILGALCKDPTLLKAIADGLDFHSFSASQMLGIPYDEFIAVRHDKSNPLYKQYNTARQNSKALTFD